MTKKKTAAAPAQPAEPYYVNPHTKEPVDYANIIAYCRHSRSSLDWTRRQIEQARAMRAPQSTLYVSDGKAQDFFDYGNRAVLEDVMAILERGVTTPPEEEPCDACGEDTSDGFHKCSMKDDEDGI